MPEETPTAQQGETPVTPATETAATTTTTTTEQKPPWGDDFTPERAWSTIQSLRQIESDFKKLKKEHEDDERAKQQAEQDRLKEQKEFEQLADQRQKRIDELEPAAKQAERYETALKKHLDSEREGLPAHILKLLDRMDVADQLEYIAENRDTLKPDKHLNGIPPTEKANGGPQTRDDIKNKYLNQVGAGKQANA